MRLLLVIAFLSIANHCLASKYLLVKNVHYRIISDRIEVFYDLPKNTDTLDVRIAFRKKSAPKFAYYPRYLTGDIGIGTFAGPKKKIVWQIEKEPKHIFAGKGFYFQVSALKLDSSEQPYRNRSK